MNRTIKQIDPNKWYHLETLKKYFVGKQMKVVNQRDENNKEFIFVLFRKLWGDYSFITHPKTKRLKYATSEAFKEIGCNL